MKKISFFAAATILLASCGNNQQTADKAKIDSMSQALSRQHIIDSMNSATVVTTVAPIETTAPVIQSHTSSSNGRTHSYSGGATRNNTAPAAAAPISAAPTVNNTATGPSAADLAAQKKADHKKELKSAAEGAMIGAGAGAIGGAVAGKNDKFKKQDAAIGGGIGAIVGAGAGLLLEKRKLKKDTTKH